MTESLFSYFRNQLDRKRSGGIVHTKQLWDKRASEWEDFVAEEGVMKQVTEARISAAVRFLTNNGCLTGDQDVIDIGCGPGRFVAEFAKTARWVTGTDLSAKMVEFGEAYCQKNGLENVTFTLCDFKEISVVEMGWEKKFDLVYSSMTPAMGSFSSLEKMIAMSRGYCCNSSCIFSGGTLEEELGKVLGEGLMRRPAWDGRGFYSLLNLVWLMGYFPYTDYYPLEFTRQRKITPDSVRETLQRLYRGVQLEEWQVEQGYEHLMSLSDNGVLTDHRSGWYGAILWDTRIQTKRW